MLNIFLNISDNRKDTNITYLSGFSPSFCILCYDDKSRKKCMFLPSFEKGMYKGIKNYAFDENSFKKNLLNHFGIKILKTVGINKLHISPKEILWLGRLLKVKFTDVSGTFLKKRMVKSRAEIEKIADACKLTDKIFSELLRQIQKHKFRTELDIKKFIKKRAIDFDADLAFDPVVAASLNSALPHHIATNKKLKGFVLIDFGMKYKGYCSDLTRMVYYGKPTSKEIEEYDRLLALQKQSIRLLEKGISLKNPDNMVRKQLGRRFLHSLGHGLGVEIHELPLISPKSENKLENGMVFSIEPGIYYKGRFGIRIEDTVVFIDGKTKILTKSSKKLRIF